MMDPKILRSDLTGQWYIVTRYTVKKSPNDAGKGVLVAHKKYDVTEEMESLIDEEIARRASAEESKIGGRTLHQKHA